MVVRFQNGETYVEIAASLDAPWTTVRDTILRYRRAIELPELGDLRRHNPAPSAPRSAPRFPEPKL